MPLNDLQFVPAFILFSSDGKAGCNALYSWMMPEEVVEYWEEKRGIIVLAFARFMENWIGETPNAEEQVSLP